MVSSAVRSTTLSRTAAAAVCLAIPLLLDSCAGKHVVAAPTAAAPTATSAPPPPPPRPSGPISTPQTRAELPPAQPIPEGAAAEPAGPFAGIPAGNPPEPIVSEPAPSPTPVRQASVEEPSPPPADPAELPQLGSILSVEQRRDFNQEIDVGIETARRLLSTLPVRGLAEDQRAAIKRIRAFIRQAQESRDQDLALAKNLAVRARVLAEDLASSGR